MERAQIEQTAKYLEGQARDGNTNSIAEQLHRMPEADRKAIAEQIKGDSAKPSSFVPTLSFADNGELKSSDIKYENGSAIHSDYDTSTGHLKSKEIQTATGDVYTEYDSKTGTRKFANTENKDGSKQHQEFDSETGNEKTTDTKMPDGSTRHVEYDPKDGHFESITTQDAQGIRERYEFDSSERITSHDKILADGTKEHDEYDPATGKPKK